MYEKLKIEAICGDTLEELKKIKTESVDLIVTDPPYNLSKELLKAIL